MKKGISKIIAGFIAIVMSVSMFAGITLAYSDNVAKQDEEIVIYFTRHGKTMLNTTGRGQGWSDSPLTPAGIEVAEYLGKGLALSNIKFDEAYSSDSGRAIETTEIILSNNGQTDLKINKDKRLREHGFGSFEGMPDKERFEYIAKAKNMTVDEYFNYMNQNGMAKGSLDHADILSSLDKSLVEEGKNWPAEDSNTIIKRLTESLDDIVNDAIKSGDHSILVTSHGLSIVALLYTLDPTAEIPSTGLTNASVSKVIYKNGKYTVESINDMSYVELGKNTNSNPKDPNSTVSTEELSSAVSIDETSKDTGSRINSSSSPKTGEISLIPSVVLLSVGFSMILVMSKKRKKD